LGSLNGLSARHKKTEICIKKREHTSLSRVGLELTIQMFERVKTFRILDRSATVIGGVKYFDFAAPVYEEFCVEVCLPPVKRPV
jgi:hypothetical protein